MASKVLQRRKKEDKKMSKILVVNKEQERLERCPVFKVHYLGKTPARGEYGREFIDEPVDTLLRLRERQSRLPKAVLQITERGFHFLDVNGPFGREKHVVIPIHHVCYGVAHEANPEVFAVITRTDSNPENCLLECHAFLCERRKAAAQITYWLLRTFLNVFEELQRRRRARQERKLRQQQQQQETAGVEATGNGAGVPVAALPAGARHQEPAGYPRAPTSPTDTIAPEVYSITVEGSKESGAVTGVSLTKSRPQVAAASAPAPPAVPATAAAPPMPQLQTRNPAANRSGRTGGDSGRKFATVPAMRYPDEPRSAGGSPGGVGASGAGGMMIGGVGGVGGSSGGARRRQPVQQLYNSHETLSSHQQQKQQQQQQQQQKYSRGHEPLRESLSTGAIQPTAGQQPPPVQRRQRNSDVTAPRPTSFNGGTRPSPTAGYPEPEEPAAANKPPERNGLPNPNAPLHHQQQEIARYQKNPRARPPPPVAAKPVTKPVAIKQQSRAPSLAGNGAPSVLPSEPGTAPGDESSYALLQMLQDELSEIGAGDSATQVAVRAWETTGGGSPGGGGGTTTPAAPPLDQKLSSEDIERRIRDWLKRNSPDAETVAFHDTGLDRISLAGTLARHNSPRTGGRQRPAGPKHYEPAKRSVRSQLSRASGLGTFSHMPSNGEYF